MDGLPPPLLFVVIAPLSLGPWSAQSFPNAQFLVGVTEALCYSGLLANSRLPPGLHKATCVGSRPASPSSITSTTNARAPSSAPANAVATTAASSGRGDGGGDGGGGMSDADVAALRGAAAAMARATCHASLFWYPPFPPVLSVGMAMCATGLIH